MRRIAIQYITITSLFLFGFFLHTENLQAQEFELYSANDIAVETIPKIPGPNQQVTLKLNSYSFNLNNYYIAWFKDGSRAAAGYGSREFSFKTGPTGNITNVTAVIEFEGQVFRKELRFAPSSVDLLWQVTDGYTPPFYKGKALPLEQSDIRVTAIPETLLIEPNDAPNLVYYWDKNYQRDASRSGFGRQYFEFTADPLVANEKSPLHPASPFHLGAASGSRWPLRQLFDKILVPYKTIYVSTYVNIFTFFIYSKTSYSKINTSLRNWRS